MQEEETSGISIKDIFKTIFTQKWLALALAVIVTLACILILNVGLDPLRREYVSTFSINLQERSGNIVYPGENTRNYRDFVSKENLEAVKAQDSEKFEAIDVGLINKTSSMTISQNRSDTEVTYTIRVRAKMFNDKKTADEFILNIAETPSREILNWVSGLATEIEQGFNERVGNESKLAYLNSKLSEISARFANLNGISALASDRVVSVADKLTAVGGVLHNSYYETDVHALESYVHMVSELNREYEIAQEVLKNLTGLSVSGASQGVSVIVDSKEIAEWSKKSVTLQQQINDYTKYLEKYGNATDGYDFSNVTETEETKAFDASLKSALNDVKGLIAHEYDYYLHTSLISFDGPVTVEGEIGLVKGVLISLVIGILVALIIAYIVGRIKINKKVQKEAVASAEEIPAEEGAVEEVVTVKETLNGEVPQEEAQEDKKSKK